MNIVQLAAVLIISSMGSMYLPDWNVGQWNWFYSIGVFVSESRGTAEPVQYEIKSVIFACS